MYPLVYKWQCLGTFPKKGITIIIIRRGKALDSRGYYTFYTSGIWSIHGFTFASLNTYQNLCPYWGHGGFSFPGLSRVIHCVKPLSPHSHDGQLENGANAWQHFDSRSKQLAAAAHSQDPIFISPSSDRLGNIKLILKYLIIQHPLHHQHTTKEPREPIWITAV